MDKHQRTFSFLDKKEIFNCLFSLIQLYIWKWNKPLKTSIVGNDGETSMRSDYKLLRFCFALLRALKVAKEKEERLRMYVKQEREKQRVVSKFA